MAQIHNVITEEASWAAKILSGSKSIEVHSDVPPSFKGGFYSVSWTVKKAFNVIIAADLEYLLAEILSGSPGNEGSGC